jgi:hypothetical protein
MLLAYRLLNSKAEPKAATDRKEEIMEEMAWGMIVAGFTMFGLLALWVVSLSMNDGMARTTRRGEPGHEPVSEIIEIKRAA